MYKCICDAYKADLAHLFLNAGDWKDLIINIFKQTFKEHSNTASNSRDARQHDLVTTKGTNMMI